MRKKCTVIWIQAFLLILFSFLSSPLAAKDDLKLAGFVRSSDGAPLGGVTIKLDGLNVIGATNENGSFEVKTPEFCVLTFSSVGYKPQNISLRGQNSLMVTLESENVGLNQVFVNKEVTDHLIADPAKLEVEHRYLKMKTRYKIPEKVFNNYTRLIIQPYVIRFSNPDLLFMLRPVVYDGRDFSIRQSRMYGDASRDPLYDYIVQPESVPDGYISYSDSLEVDNLDFDFYTYTKAYIETCCDIVYKDTIIVSRGLVNPMKFYDNALGPQFNKMGPQEFLGPRNKDGAINIMFDINRAEINEKLGRNKYELDSIRYIINSIDKADQLDIKKLELMASASPDGIYAKNKILAEQRLEASMNYLTAQLSLTTKNNMQKVTNAFVADWTQVANLVRKDDPKTAESIDNLIKKHGKNRDNLSSVMRKQKYYGVLAETYLPMLRRTDYKLTYVQNRVATEEEVNTLFKEKKTYASTTISEYEYWKKFMMDNGGMKNNKPKEDFFPDTTNTQKNEINARFLTQMIKDHPTSVWAVNNLMAYNLILGRPDVSVFENFKKARAEAKIKMQENPELANYKELTQNELHLLSVNHLLTLLALNKPEEAKGLINNPGGKGLIDKDDLKKYASQLASDSSVNVIKASLAVKEGKYGEALSYLRNQKPSLNKVLLLLKAKKNDEAYAEVLKLNTGSAKEMYVKAICANRLNKMHDALNYLKNAISLDPSLKEQAIMDSDLNDLL